VRFDLLFIDHPAQHFRSAIGGVANQSSRRKIEALFDPVDHRLGRIYFVTPVRRCGLDIDDDPGLYVDQVVGRVRIERWSTGCCGPLRSRIGRGDILGRPVRCLGVVQRLEILADRMGERRLAIPSRFDARDTFLTIGICFDDAGVYGEPLASDQTFGETAIKHLLKHEAQCVVVAESPVAILRERRVIGNSIFQAEPAEPAIGEVQVDLFAQPTLRANSKAVAHDQHPDQQRRINGWSAGMAVVRGEVLVQFAQVEKPINPAEHVARRDVVLEVEGVEERRLSGVLTSHHRCGFRWIDGRSVKQLQQSASTEFFNGIDPKQIITNGRTKPQCYSRPRGRRRRRRRALDYVDFSRPC